MKPMQALAFGSAILAASALSTLEGAAAHRVGAAVELEGWRAYDMAQPVRRPPWNWRGGWGWGGATIGIGLGSAAPFSGTFGYGPVDYVYGYPYYRYPSRCYLDQRWGPHGLRLARICPP
jgi:hypothetical protein